MTASIPIFSPMVRVTDADGEPVANGTVEFYNAGTSTAKTVYADKDLSTALGTTVSTDAGGYPVTSGNARTLVYTGTDAFKMIVKDSSGATLVTHDNVPGAVIVPEAETSALSETPVVSKTTNYTVVAGDQGTILNCNCTSASFAITLLSAVTAGDGFEVTVRHAGTANQVTIRTAGTETISHSGKASYAVSLKAYGQALVLVSDGANWLVKASAEPRMLDGTPHFNVVDRLTATPSSPTAGARYIISGSPTGTWSTLGFSSGQVAEADGNGSWFAYTPAEGWSAWVEDEHLQTVYISGAWTDWTNVTAPTETALGVAIYSYTVPQNTAGGSATNSAWTAYPLNTEDHDTIGASINSGTYTITLPTGTYLARMSATFYAAQTARFRVSNVTTTAKVYGMLSYSPAFGTTPPVATASTTVMVAPFSVSAATEDIKIEYYQVGASATLGVAQNVSSLTEKYGQLEIIKLDAQQGPQGEQGIQGADGLDAAYDYQWSTATSGDPGAGKALMDNATFASVTQINISETTASGANIAAVLAMMDDSTNDNKCLVRISKEGAPQNFKAFVITAAGTDQGSYWTFPVTPVDDDGTISNADDLAILFVPYGDKGATGATGSAGATGATGATGAAGPTVAIGFNYSTTTADADPGSGIFRLNNATLASVTEAYFDNNERGGTDVSAWLDSFDDSGVSGNRGHLLLIDTADSTEFQLYKVTGSVTDGTGYRKVSLTWIAGKAAGSFTNGGEIAATFIAFGQTGAVSGLADGSVGTPSLSFASDTDNGLYRSGTDKWHLVGSGASILTVDGANARIGIGTAAPAEKLEIYDASAPTLKLNNGTYSTTLAQGSSYVCTLATRDLIISSSYGGTIEMTSHSKRMFIHDTYGMSYTGDIFAGHTSTIGFVTYGATTTYRAIVPVYTDNNTSGLAFSTKASGTDTERMRIDSPGNVGIGTTAPSCKLDVDGIVRPKSYTVATLPTIVTGGILYASDGRKNGEGAAAGTGVLVFADGSNWIAVDNGQTVAA